MPLKVIPALVMGLGHPRQTAFLRSLNKQNIPVHTVHTEMKAERWSRHLSSFTQIPADQDGQLEHLVRWGKKTGGFLIPTNDDYVGLVSKNHALLSQYYNISIPDYGILEPLLDRIKSYRIAESAGIRVPQLWSPETHEELESALNSLTPDKSDYILKTHSVLNLPADDKNVRQTIAAPREPAAIASLCRQIQQRTGQFPIIQEVIPGAADAAIGVTMVVAPDGDIKLCYCVQRLRLATYKVDAGYVHPYELGSVVWCQTVHDDEAVDATRALIKQFNYTGIIVVEFRRDSRDGQLYFMKVEPRPVRATSLSSAIGMDVPFTLYSAFNGGDPKVATDYKDNVGWLWGQVYLQSLFQNPHHNRRDLLRVLKSFRNLKAFGEDFTDPLPLAAGVAKLSARCVSTFVRKLANKVSLAPK